MLLNAKQIDEFELQVHVFFHQMNLMNNPMLIQFHSDIVWRNFYILAFHFQNPNNQHNNFYVDPKEDLFKVINFKYIY